MLLRRVLCTAVGEIRADAEEKQHTTSSHDGIEATDFITPPTVIRRARIPRARAALRCAALGCPFLA